MVAIILLVPNFFFGVPAIFAKVGCGAADPDSPVEGFGGTEPAVGGKSAWLLPTFWNSGGKGGKSTWGEKGIELIGFAGVFS